MFQATAAIYEALTQDGDLKVFTSDGEKSSEVWLAFNVKNGGNYRIRFISTGNDNSVAVRVFELLSVSEDKAEQIYKAINELNCKYRYAKFCCGENGNISVEYDYPLGCSNPSESAKEIIIRFVQIINEAYPVLMHALWA